MFRLASILACASLSLSLLAGCTAETASPGTTTPDTAREPSPTTKVTDARRGAALFVAALNEPLRLTAEQRAGIEALRAKLPSSDNPFGLKMMGVLETALRADPFDRAPLDALIAEAEREQAETAKLHASLHGILSKDQRAQLIAALEAKEPDAEAQKKLIIVRQKAVEAQHKAIEAQARADGNTTVPAPRVVGAEALQERIDRAIAERRARLRSFIEDDFDATRFSHASAPMKPLVESFATMPLEKRVKMADSFAHARAKGMPALGGGGPGALGGDPMIVVTPRAEATPAAPAAPATPAAPAP